MSEELTFIPASEAAEMVGVSAQTIRNLCKAKTLRYQMRTNLFYVCKEDVERYAQSISEVNEIERSVEDYKREINKAYEQIREAKQEMQDRLEDMNMFPERIEQLFKILFATLDHERYNLSSMEEDIIKQVLKGEKLPDIAKENHWTREQARQIYEKALHKISYYPQEIAEKNKIIAERDKIIYDLQESLVLAEKASISPEMAQLLQQHIYEFELPVRTLNCLKAADIDTVKDLVQHKKSDFKNFRNFGRKSLQDLDEFVTALGLTWGMKFD